jgi:hypothetical protein
MAPRMSQHTPAILLGLLVGASRGSLRAFGEWKLFLKA